MQERMNQIIVNKPAFGIGNGKKSATGHIVEFILSKYQ
jgi:hypothetical protein